jgi:hypothetical protein
MSLVNTAVTVFSSDENATETGFLKTPRIILFEIVCTNLCRDTVRSVLLERSIGRGAKGGQFFFVDQCSDSRRQDSPLYLGLG